MSDVRAIVKAPSSAKPGTVTVVPVACPSCQYVLGFLDAPKNELRVLLGSMTVKVRSASPGTEIEVSCPACAGVLVIKDK